MEPIYHPISEIPKLEMIGEIEYDFFRLGAFRAALQLELWNKIASGEDTVEKLVTREGWNPAGVQILLDAICALKLMTKTGEHYALTPEADFYLIAGKPTYRGNLLFYEYHWDGDGKLAETIRSGKRPVGDDAASPNLVPLWIAEYSHRWAYPQSYFEMEKIFWETLEIHAIDGLRVLDIGCGPAPRTMELARQHAGVQLSWVDWEGVLQTASKVAGELGIEGQISLLPGDLWTVDYGTSSFDVAYLGNITHFFSFEENITLFHKVYTSLATGGIIVVNSVVRKEKESSVWDGLWLYMVTVGGGRYDFGEYRAMLERVGFVNIQDINQGPIKAFKY